MLRPTTSWTCDTCGQKIAQASHGWVEWISPFHDSGQTACGHDLRLVHQKAFSPRTQGCYLDHGEARASFHLHELQGPDGLMQMLEMIAEKCLPTEDLL